MMNLEKAEVPSEMPKDKLTLADKWILSKVNTLATEVTDNMDRYELGIAVQKVYDFIWEEFCDWYIEMVKPRLYSETDETKGAALWTLKTVLGNALKLLHPFMPFITEEIYCTLNPDEDSIMIAAWPKETEDFAYAEDESAVEMMKEAVRSIRGVRTSMNVPPSKKASVFVVTEDAAVQETFKNGAVFFGTLAGASEVHVQADKAGIADDAVSAVIPQQRSTFRLPSWLTWKRDRPPYERGRASDKRDRTFQRHAWQPELYQQSSGSKGSGRERKTGELSADDGAGSDKIGAAEKINEKRKKTAWKQGNRSESLQLALFAAAGPGMLYSVSGD